LYSNVYRRRVAFSITVASSRLQKFAMRDVFRGQAHSTSSCNPPPSRSQLTAPGPRGSGTTAAACLARRYKALPRRTRTAFRGSCCKRSHLASRAAYFLLSITLCAPIRVVGPRPPAVVTQCTWERRLAFHTQLPTPSTLLRPSNCNATQRRSKGRVAALATLISRQHCYAAFAAAVFTRCEMVFSKSLACFSSFNVVCSTCACCGIPSTFAQSRAEP